MAEIVKTYTPEEVFNKKDEADSVSKKKLIGRGFLIASLAIVVIMGIIFLISLLYSEEGSFTVRVGDLSGSDGSINGISLSETPGFANPTVKLSGIPMDGMDNITYDWLPLDELDTIPGSHNGENYIAYTFYVKNSSASAIDYSVAFNIKAATLGVDKAIRVMIYRDGTPTIYAKKADDGSVEKVPADMLNFESDATVVTDLLTDISSGEMHKYTVVIWLEGEDPDCTDAILKGILKFEIDLKQVVYDN